MQLGFLNAKVLNHLEVSNFLVELSNAISRFKNS